MRAYKENERKIRILYREETTDTSRRDDKPVAGGNREVIVYVEYACVHWREILAENWKGEIYPPILTQI